MAKDAVATMGTILTPDVGGRDAVHVAVISAEASSRLRPGDHVCRRDASTAERLIVGLVAADGHEPIGIVDPFLENVVQKGQRFWLYLYPRTITSLRHNWTHPAFADAPVNTSYSPPSHQLASHEWIGKFAGRYGFTANRMIEAAKEYQASGEYWCEGGTFEGEHVPDEFWIHFERATGIPVDADKRDNFFTCSC